MIVYIGMLSDIEREFVGWFWGEGSFLISKVKSYNSKNKKAYFRPEITITQRDDDVEALKWAKERFGGWFYHRKHKPRLGNYIANPRIQWQVVGFRKCRIVLDVLKQGILPCKKIKEIVLFSEFLDTAVGSGRETTSGLLIKQEKMFNKLKSLHQYHGSSI